MQVNVEETIVRHKIFFEPNHQMIRVHRNLHLNFRVVNEKFNEKVI